MNGYRVLVVDDEPAARRGLKRRLDSYTEFTRIDLCSNGFEAVEKLQTQRYDLAFLDIQMPEIDGFDVVEQVGQAMPPVVFVTAYDAFAMKAFEVHALDYLLKPLNKQRFEASMLRLLDLLKKDDPGDMREKLQALIGDCRTMVSNQAPETNIDKLMVRDRGSYYFIEIMDMFYCRVEGNYVLITTAQKEYWIRETLGNLCSKLGSQRFLRIARQLLINRHHITAIHPFSKGTYRLSLTSGLQLKSSRHYQASIKAFLKEFQN